MEVYGYDNYLSVESALRMTRNLHRVESVKTIYEECDYITYHVPLNDSTRRYINKEVFAQMKDGVRLFNFSRGEIVNEDDLEEALNSGKVAKYVTDFPNERILSMKNVIAIPHLAASTMESEDNCAVMAVDELKDYLENGNVKNSVNFPNVVSERASGARICVLHKNIPNMLSRISSVLGEMDINIEFMHSKSRGEIGYALLDLAGSVPAPVAENLRNIDGVLLVRIIN
jgi:D-3-phosphoglycerate dehydrogenase